MSANDALAARLRQAIQGCSLHNHGPVQAWAAIQDANTLGEGESKEVARLAMQACSQRITELLESGVDAQDPRIKKEELTRAFIENLFL